MDKLIYSGGTMIRVSAVASAVSKMCQSLRTLRECRLPSPVLDRQVVGAGAQVAWANS